MEPRTAEPNSTDDRTRAADVLVENHRAFLRFLERRVGDRALAEDLLQEAFTRNLDRLSGVPDEGLVPWFYRVLRNAAIDRHRRKGAEERRWRRSRRSWPTWLSPPRTYTGGSARAWGGWRAR